MFADATCAGLSTLIPIPGLDLLAELVFRRRLPRTVARHRGVNLGPAAVAGLGGSGGSWLSPAGCAALPLIVLFWLLKRISRKILYFLTIKETAQQLSAYWHRAYLVDHVLRSDRLDSEPEVVLAAFHQTLEEADTDSLTGLARQVVASAHGVGHTLLRARRGRAAAATSAQEAQLEGQWSRMEQALATTITHYEQLLLSTARGDNGERPAATP